MRCTSRSQVMLLLLSQQVLAQPFQALRTFWCHKLPVFMTRAMQVSAYKCNAVIFAVRSKAHHLVIQTAPTVHGIPEPEFQHLGVIEYGVVHLSVVYRAKRVPCWHCKRCSAQ